MPGPQPLWAKVLTPNGWSTMGALSASDEVIGRDGMPHKILKTFDKGVKDIYKITTTTGKTAYSCEDHLWSTQNYNEHKHNKPFVVRSLKEIKDTLLYNNGKINHYLPRNDVIQYEKKPLPIPPYVLGCLLGDGSMPQNGALGIHNIEMSIIDRMNEELKTIGAKINYHSVQKGISYTICNIDDVPNKPSRRIRVTKGGEEITFESRIDCERYFGISPNKITSLCDRPNTEYIHNGWTFERMGKNKSYTNVVKDALNNLGLLGRVHFNKYIPEIYKYGSVDDRLNLLRGLLDTDGHGHKRGQAHFTTVSEQLRDDVIEIVRSLGGSTFINKRDRRNCVKERTLEGRKVQANYISYTIGISIPNMNPFYLERKAVQYNANVRCFYLDRILEVSKYSTEEAKCILLDSQDHLYITDDYMVTHNTMDDKFSPYLRPLKDTIDTLVRAKYKVAISKNKEALEEKIVEFNEKYNISYEAMNFLRGGTIKNSLIIIDEAQNISISGMKLILTRVGENCKVFILGDTQQIDSKYSNERNNALTYMMNLVGTQEDIRIVGLDFNKTIRSKIAGWAAENI